MKALELKIKGDVQQVGYRRSVWRIANRMNVKGYIRNLPDGTVNIVAEGEEQALQNFVKSIGIKEPPILVEEVKAKGRKPTGRYRYFRVRTESVAEDIQEGLGAGEAQLNVFRREFRDYRQEFTDYREEFRDYRKEFGEFTLKTDRNFKSLEARYGVVSEKLAEILQTLQKESVETRRELTRAVDTLTQLIQKLTEQSNDKKDS